MLPSLPKQALIDVHQLARAALEDKGAFTKLARLVIDAWIRSKPEQYRNFITACQREYDSLKKQSGMSEGGTMAYKGLVPTEVHVVMSRFDPSYSHSPTKVAAVQEMIMPRNTHPYKFQAVITKPEENNAAQAKGKNEAGRASQYLFDREK